MITKYNLNKCEELILERVLDKILVKSPTERRIPTFKAGLELTVSKEFMRSSFYGDQVSVKAVTNEIWDTYYSQGEKLEAYLRITRDVINNWLNENRKAGLLEAFRTDLEHDLISASRVLCDNPEATFYIMLRESGTQFETKLNGPTFDYYRRQKGYKFVIFEICPSLETSKIVETSGIDLGALR